MGQGLGRNSPVQLSLGKDNYEALIERHGQWVRWRIANKCSCVSLPSMQPDIHCKICGGRGYTYQYQKTQIVYQTVMIKDVSGIIIVSEEYHDCELVEIYDFNGKRYSGYKYGIFVYVEDDLPYKGSYLTIVMRKTLTKVVKNAVAEKQEMGFYKVPGLENSRTNIEGIYYNTPSDIIKIGKITDANGEEYEALEYRLNTFVITPKVVDEEIIPIAEPVTVENVEYVPPFIFALLNQNLSKTDAQAVSELSGDAVLTFPYECDVSNDDIVTVLAGTYTQKEVNPRSEFETDTLGVYFVYDIVSCTGIINGETVEYKEGVDFVLVGTNKIKWLDTVNTPDVGDSYSITYHVLPTYKVVKQIPQLRTSENQRFPKKAVVKLFTTYSEKLGANKQNVKSFYNDGSL